MERLIGVLGLAAILGCAYLLSYDRRAIAAKPILVGLALEVLFAVLVLRVPPVQTAFHSFADGAESLIRLSDRGASLLFGCLLDGEAPVVAAPPATAPGAATPQVGVAKLSGVLMVRMLPPIIFFSALSALLFHLGILQLVVGALARLMTRCMGVSGAEALSASANTVLGMTEAPLLVRPYLARLTDSELVAVMTGGFATSAGGMLALYMSLGIPARFLLAASLMAAPASLLIAKIILPETRVPDTAGQVRVGGERTETNALEAIAAGTSVGLKLALNVAAMLIAFMGLIALVNVLLGCLGGGLSLERIFGWIFAPFAFLLGVPCGESVAVGQLLGTKIGVNELIAYQAMTGMPLSDRAVAIASFALCGFANIGSIGIQIGGLGSLAPERRGDLARFGVRAMLGGALASTMTAAVAGLLL